MKNVGFALLGVCMMIIATGCATGVAPSSSAYKGWTADLNRLGLDGSIGTLANPRDWRVKQVSSFDARGGNNDDVSVAYRFDGGAVLADMDGPGCITRIWCQDPKGMLAVYLDGSALPVICVPFDLLFTSHAFPYGSLLVGEAAGGRYCYIPIPFKDHCRVALYSEEEQNLYYQITYAEFAEEACVSSMCDKLTPGDKAFFDRWQKNWQAAPEIRMHDPDTETLHHTSRVLWPKKNILIYPMEGPGVITEIEMFIDSVDPYILQNAWIAIYWDRQPEPSVLAPLGAFFGCGAQSPPDYAGLAFGKKGTRMWCRYPMPFAEYAQIRLINNSDQKIDFAYNLTWREEPVCDKRYFHAGYNCAETVSGQPFVVAEISGQGHFAGCNIAAKDGATLDFLEGDDVIVVDGERLARYHGTGTEHYFNAGNHFSGVTFSKPLHGCTVLCEQKPTAAAAYRTHVTDAVPFRESLRFSLEHGGRNNAPGAVYAGVAYWYLSKPSPIAWEVPGVDMCEK